MTGTQKNRYDREREKIYKKIEALQKEEKELRKKIKKATTPQREILEKRKKEINNDLGYCSKELRAIEKEEIRESFHKEKMEELRKINNENMINYLRHSSPPRPRAYVEVGKPDDENYVSDDRIEPLPRYYR